MPRARLPLRLLFVGVVAIAAALLVGLLVSTLNGVLELYARVSDLPLWLRAPLVTACALVLVGIAWFAWRFARGRPGPSTRPRDVPTRESVDTRIDILRKRHAETAALEAELADLDRRRATEEVYVAVFGEVSTGKSSLIRALAPAAAPDVDVRGGTTRSVEHHRGTLADDRDLILADVPGSREIDGKLREQLARDEALRAHLVLYVCATDLTRAQHEELDWLVGFGKPVVIVLNKVDRYSDAERDALLARIREQWHERVVAILAISAGGTETFERIAADGRREKVERERQPEIANLRAALGKLVAGGATGLEPAREAAVLSAVHRRGEVLARETARAESERIVARYTRRAIVGALAAVMPGSDILIQGALGTALVRELARVHEVPVRELDIEALMSRLGLTVRNTSAIVLAIAGNALKAFPGLGTLGGGVMHAVAYGLVFDSVGHALAATLAERAQLDVAEVELKVRGLLAEPARERMERVARLVLESARERGEEKSA
jgi:GTP-binding protein EngB required for normal cell division